MKTSTLLLMCLFFLCLRQTKAQAPITDFHVFLQYAKEKSIALKNGTLNVSQAKKAKLSSIYGVIEPTGSLSASFTNNTRLPVTLVPSEILGGQPGSFEKVKFGVQYVTSANAYAEIKLINLQGWENLKLARLNIQIAETNNKVSLKNLYENIAVIYYNILTLQEQLASARTNALIADSLYQSTLRKYNLGIVRKQDADASEINLLKTEASIQQIGHLISEQYNALKLLCDIPENEPLRIEASPGDVTPTEVNIDANTLEARQAILQEQSARISYKQNQYSFLPSLSVFASHQEQQFNEQLKLYDNRADWISSNYVGIKLLVPIPTANAIAQSSRARYSYLVAKNDRTKKETEASLYISQLSNSYQKALSERNSNGKIYELQKDIYNKDMMNYNEGIISLDLTLESFTNMVNSGFNLISSTYSVLLAQEKININNTIK